MTPGPKSDQIHHNPWFALSDSEYHYVVIAVLRHTTRHVVVLGVAGVGHTASTVSIIHLHDVERVLYDVGGSCEPLLHTQYEVSCTRMVSYW